MRKPAPKSAPINLENGIRQTVGGGVFGVTKRVPVDLIGRPRPSAPEKRFSQFIKLTTGTTDVAMARHVGAGIIQAWDAEFAVARGALADLPQEVALTALDRWRQLRVDALQAIDLAPRDQFDLGFEVSGAALAALAESLSGVVEWPPKPSPVRVNAAVVEAGNRYFDLHPNASRETFVLPGTRLRLDRLARAITDPHAWVHLAEFDIEMLAAVRAGGADGRPPYNNTTRHRFAVVWRDVAQHEEATRLKAAQRLAAAEAERLNPAMLNPTAAPATFEPRPDDVTVGELVDAYRADISKTRGPEVMGRHYNHIFRAIRETWGDGTPARSIVKADARAIRDLLIEAPTHATKKFPGLTLTQAVARAKEIDRDQEDDELLLPRMAPATVTSYMDKLSGLMGWAEAEGLVDKNYAAGLGVGNEPRLKRRSFAREELVTIFQSLRGDYATNGWKFWLAAMLHYTGARAGELVQLRRNDLGEHNGIHYIRVSIYDAVTRKRGAGLSIKNAGSERLVPLHHQLIELGVLDYIRARTGPDVFADIPKAEDRARSHRASRWFGDHLDRLGLKSPAICLHSFRHGLADAAREVELDPERRRALGGWSTQSASENYGTTAALRFLNKDMQRLRWDGFDMRAALNDLPQPGSAWSPST